MFRYEALQTKNDAPSSPSIRENIPKTARNVNTGARNLCGTEAEINAGVRSM